MPFKKTLSIFETLALLIKKLHEEQQNYSRDIYRVVEIKQPPSGQIKIVFQIVGKATIVECTPQEIVVKDQLIEGFSKKDIRAITYYASLRVKKPKYKIVMQEFCDQLNRMFFRLRKVDEDKVILKTASEITLDKSLIDQLSQEDVKSISYMAGYEHSLREKSQSENA